MMDKKVESSSGSTVTETRIGTFDLFIRNTWCKVQAELNDERLQLTLNESFERFTGLNTEIESPENVDEIANRKRKIHIRKKPSEGLGISIKGGKENRMPILISKIFRGMPADLCGDLFVGDAVLSVNDVNLRDANHEEAVQSLKNAGEDVILEVRYLPEVVPFFRKAAILSEIGWRLPLEIEMLLNVSNQSTNDQEGEALTSNEQQSANIGGDVKVIPLAGAFVRRVQMTKTTLLSSLGSPSSKFSLHNESDYDPIVLSDSSTSESIFQEVIVIQSPDLARSCVLAPENDIKFTSWFNAIQRVILNLNQIMVNRLNKLKKKHFSDSKIVSINWFLEQKCSKLDGNSLLNDPDASSKQIESSSLFEQHEKDFNWKPVFIIVTTRDLQFYDQHPLIGNKLSHPICSWPLLQVHLIYLTRSDTFTNLTLNNTSNIPISSSKSSSLSSIPEQSKMSITSTFSLTLSPIRFGLRIGTSMGIEIKLLCAQNYSELNKFSLKLIELMHTAVEEVKTITFPSIYETAECVLLLTYKKGIKLVETVTGRVLYEIPFQQLKSIVEDDDGHKVSLQYNHDSNLHLDMLQNTKPFLFTLHSFLASQLSELKIN